MKKEKIILAYPNLGSEAKGMSLYPPLSVLYLASHLPDYSVEIFDQRVDSPEKFEKLLDENPVCVGISTMTGIQIKHSLELAEKVKKKNIPTVFGGVHPTILPEQTLEDPRVDYVITGEGEISFRKLVENIKSGKNSERLIIGENPDIKTIPQIPYDLVDVENYTTTAAISGRTLPFLFSRGCPQACTFCCNPVLHKRKWRSMDVSPAFSQLEEIVSKYSLDSVIFWDENLGVNPRILNSLAEKINNRFKWYMQVRANSLLNLDLNFLEKMGAYRFSIGLESGSPDMLKRIRKEETVSEYIEVNRRLAKTSISQWYNYIVGYPEESIDDLKATVNLALQILDENKNAINSTFAMLVPYPGTEISDKYLQRDMLPQTLAEWADFGRYNFSSIWHPKERMDLYKKINFSSKFVGRKFSNLHPENTELRNFELAMTQKWREFDFYNESEWEEIYKEGWNQLKKMFGDKAY